MTDTPDIVARLREQLVEANKVIEAARQAAAMQIVEQWPLQEALTAYDTLKAGEGE